MKQRPWWMSFLGCKAKRAIKNFSLSHGSSLQSSKVIQCYYCLGHFWTCLDNWSKKCLFLWFLSLFSTTWHTPFSMKSHLSSTFKGCSCITKVRALLVMNLPILWLCEPVILSMDVHPPKVIEFQLKRLLVMKLPIPTIVWPRHSINGCAPQKVTEFQLRRLLVMKLPIPTIVRPRHSINGCAPPPKSYWVST